jgi:hypothetical protein
MYLVDFFKSHEIKLFYLWNEHLDYMKRGPKDRIIYDAKDYARLKNLFGKAINLVEELNYKPESISCINTSEFNLEQTTNFIKQNLWNKNTKNP